MTRKSIGIVGARGIANYGGFETFVAELASRLVEKDYEVYCSCERDDELKKDYKGAKLVYFPIEMPSNYQFRKVVEFFYDIYFGFLFTFKCDVVYFLGFSANIFTLFPRLFGKLSLVNMGGVEWERSKFSNLERFLLKFFFKLSVIGSDYIIIDNKKLINYIESEYYKKAIYITYGVNEIAQIKWNQSILNEYTNAEIIPNNYWLAVARLQPDNNIADVLKAFIKSESKIPLVVIGDYATVDDYRQQIETILNNKNNKKIILTGGIYNQEHLNMFRQNCFGYIHPHSIGGTNPSLLEAMVMKNIIIAHENEFNREVCNEAVLYFRDFQDLKNKIDLVEQNPTKYDEFKQKCYLQVKNKYSWDTIVEEYSILIDEKGY